MGTRSLTFVEDENNSTLVCMYLQYDGYPSGHGKDLYDFLKDFTIVNGFTLEQQEYKKCANGFGCLAAQLVSHFKKGIGGSYLYPTDTTDAWQDYTYTIKANRAWEACEEKFGIVVRNCNNEVLFDGNLNEFKTFCEHDEY